MDTNDTDPKYIEKRQTALLAGLRQALTHPEEQRLYKSGRLDGLFPSKLGPSGDAAALALREGYLELVRVEEKGKFLFQWVRIAPNGIEYLYQHDSPRAVLNELKELLDTARSGTPAWMDAMIQQMENLAHKFADQMKFYLQRLDALGLRIEEALRRIDASEGRLSEGLATIVPWGVEALRYLDQRKLAAVSSPCSLSELFEFLKTKHTELGLKAYHDGLRRLADHRALQLLPATSPKELARPELALMNGSDVLFYVSR